MEQSNPRTVDAEWRRWIAENVLLNKEEASIVAAMVRVGFDPALATAEVRAALDHPYIAAARQLALLGTSQTESRELERQLKKRDWVLQCLRRSARLDPTTQTIPRVPPPSSDQFLHEYYAANRPVVIEGAMENWDAIEKWTGPNLKQKFGDREVEVQANRSSDQNYERNSTKLRKVMSFGDFVDIAESPVETNDWYMTAQNSGKNSDALRELWNDIIPFPQYLSSTSGKTSGFFWYGPSGTLTPLHHDLTNNFMAQVRGRKRVKLIAPTELPRIYNDRHCFSQVNPAKADLARFPQFAEVSVIDVLIGPGDLLFLPVGWWHQVQAVGTSITMTFTNFIHDNDFSSFYPHGV